MPSVEVGDRVSYDGQQAIVRRLHGMYHATVYFGTHNLGEITKYVKRDKLEPGAEIVTTEQIIARDPYLAPK